MLQETFVGNLLGEQRKRDEGRKERQERREKDKELIRLERERPLKSLFRSLWLIVALPT